MQHFKISATRIHPLDYRYRYCIFLRCGRLRAPCEAVTGEAMGTLMSDDRLTMSVMVCAVRTHSRQVLI